MRSIGARDVIVGLRSAPREETVTGLFGVAVFGILVWAGKTAFPNLWISLACFMAAAGVAIAVWLDLCRRERARQLIRRVTSEISAIIGEGRKVRGDVFTAISWPAYVRWSEKTCRFLDIVLGPHTVDLFTSDQEAHPASMSTVIGWRISALEDLLRSKSEWEIRIDHHDLSKAIDQRRAFTRAERILVSGTPAEEWALGGRPQAPITVGFDYGPEGVIEVPDGGEAQLLMTMTMRNADSPDIEDMAIIFEVPSRFGLEICDEEGRPSDVGEVKLRPLAGVRQWQLLPHRLRGSGPTSFSFRLVARDPRHDDLFKLSLRMPGYASMIQYEKPPVVTTEALAAA